MKWAKGVVAEMEITISATDAMAVAAHQELHRDTTLDVQDGT